MEMPLIEAKEIVKLRPLSTYERQQRFRYGANLLDPRISDLLVYSARLVRENQWLRKKGIAAGLKLAKHSAVKLEAVPDPFQSDAHHYPDLPEELTAADLVRPKPAKAGRQRLTDQRFGFGTDATS